MHGPGRVRDDGAEIEYARPAALGGIAMLPELLAGGDVDRVIVAFSSRPDHEILDALRNSSGYRGAVDIVPRLFEFVAPRDVTYSLDELRC